eukprot:scaffold284914_cov32-Tisochrysis_lutea.AAC.8
MSAVRDGRLPLVTLSGPRSSDLNRAPFQRILTGAFVNPQRWRALFGTSDARRVVPADIADVNRCPITRTLSCATYPRPHLPGSLDERSRNFASTAIDRLALSPRRGLGSLVQTSKRRIFLLDLEEDPEDEDNEDENMDEEDEEVGDNSQQQTENTREEGGCGASAVSSQHDHLIVSGDGTADVSDDSEDDMEMDYD